MFRLIKISTLILAALVVTLGNSGVVQAAELTEQQRKEQALQKSSFYAQNDVLYTGEGCGEASTGGEGSTAGNTSVDCGVDKDGDKGNKDKIWEYLVGKFKEQGYSGEEAEKAAAGVMGNMWQETGGSFNPNIDHGMGCESGPAIGLNQWCFERQTNLKSVGKESGKGWGCLGVQLDFLWGEMDSGFKHLYPLMKGKSPGDVARIFDDGGDGPSGGIRGFEESIASDNDKRAGYADDIYKEYTGKGPGTSGGGGGAPSAVNDSSSEENEAAEEECPSEEADTNVPGDCGGLVNEVEKLHKSGKLIMPQKPNQDKDLKNCTDGQVECGTDGGKGGVKKKFLQSFVTIIKAAPGPVTLWNMNTGHMCDGLNHPKGKAVDIPCGAGTTPIEVCKKMIDFAISNKGSLGLTEILWQQNYRCGDGVDCSVGGHDDHIHFGVGGA